MKWMFGGALAVVLAAAGYIGLAGAADAPVNPVLNSIVPCRIIDTRPSPNTVGPRSTALKAAETYTVKMTGAQGDCSVPTSAASLVLNVTVVEGTAPSWLTVWPAGTPVPTASNLNWVPGPSPIANQVTVGLPGSGEVSFRNQLGRVHLVVDVTGYYADHDHDASYYTKAEIDALVSANPGPKGDPGVNGISGYETIVETGTFTMAQIDADFGGLRLVGASCPEGKKLTNQGIVWGLDPDVDPDLQTPGWKDQFPNIVATTMSPTDQAPVFWISTDMMNTNGVWYYKARSICATG